MRCTRAVRLALIEAPVALISTGKAPPTATPSVIGSAVANVSAPVMLSACRIPMAAADDWMIAVNTIPTMMPLNGLENDVRSDTKLSLSLRGVTASLIVLMPNISTANPRSMVPTLLAI